MSQVDDFVIPTPPASLSGTQLVVENLNPFFAALASQNKGPAAPQNPAIGMGWLDDSASPLWSLRVYAGGQGGWIALGVVDSDNGTFTPAGQMGDVTPTGTVLQTIALAAPSGWIVLDGRTIGAPASGAAFAGTAAEALFLMLWDSIVTSPIFDSAGGPTGRGASGPADWAANKRLALPNARSRMLIGSGQGPGLSHRPQGGIGGAEFHQLTWSEMPAHTHNIAISSGADGGFTRIDRESRATTSSQATESAGGNVPHNNMPPFLALTTIIKL